MTASYRIDVDTKQLKRAIANFEFVGGNIDDAIRIAINKTIPKARTAANKMIRKQVRLFAPYIKEKLKVKKATRKRLDGSIAAESRGLLITRFSTDPGIANPNVSWLKAPKVTDGVRVKIKPTGPGKALHGDADTKGDPFYIVLKSSRALGVAILRETPGLGRSGRIKVFYGPSVSQVFGTVREDITPDASEEMTHQIIDAMRYILVMRKPPEPVNDD